METIKRYSKLALTGDLEIQMTCNKTIWKAYEIVYNSFSNLKALFKPLPGRIHKSTELCPHKAESKQKLEPNFKQL